MIKVKVEADVEMLLKAPNSPYYGHFLSFTVYLRHTPTSHYHTPLRTTITADQSIIPELQH